MDSESEIFSIREKLRRARSWSGIFHLMSVALAVAFLVVAQAKFGQERGLASQEKALRVSELRQALIEVLDRVVRYEHYHHEVYGRFTRDLHRLALPEKLTRSTVEEVRRYYEISVVESGPSRVLVMATGAGVAAGELSLLGDRVIVDEHFRLQGNFPMPEPSRGYLLEDADRKIRNALQGKGRYRGIYADYWRIEKSNDPGEPSVVAVGQRGVIAGERHSWIEPLTNVRDPASVARPEIFQSVRDRLRNRVLPEQKPVVEVELAPKEFRVDEVRAWLEQVRLAQHVHWRERGRFAHRWEELEQISGLRSPLRPGFANNVKVLPIEVPSGGRSYRVTVEGKSGDLLGEQFVLDQTGAVRQIRYTDAIARDLQRSTEMLQDALNFQVEEIPSETPPVLDTPKSRPVK